jgi:hypothetical protein
VAHPLDSTAAKVQRAEANYAALNHDAGVWLDEAAIEGETVTVSKTVDLQSGDIHFVAETVPEAPIRRWGAITGDIVHNLRCALDHLAFALADLANPQRIDDNVTQFPIARSQAHWDTDAIQRRFTYISDRHKTMIKEVQPWFVQPNDVAIHPLSTLERLDNHDKHRLIQVVALGFDLWSFYPNVAPFVLTNATITWHAIHEEPLIKGAKLMTVRITKVDPDGPEPDVDMKPIRAAPNLFLGPGSPIKYVVPNLTRVVREVIGTFASEF